MARETRPSVISAKIGALLEDGDFSEEGALLGRFLRQTGYNRPAQISPSSAKYNRSLLEIFTRLLQNRPIKSALFGEINILRPLHVAEHQFWH